MKTLKKFSEKPVGVIHFSDLKTFKGQFVYWTIMLVLLVISVICLIPALWTLATGFKTSQEMYQAGSFLPQNLSWERITTSLAEAWYHMNATKTSLNTLFIAVVSTVVTIVVDGFAGYVLSRLKPKGSRFVFMLIVWTMMMPAQLRMVPVYISYMNFPLVANTAWQVNILDTYWPIILGSATGAFTVILFKNSFDAISKSLIDAATLDGCGYIRIFFHIMLPLSVPMIMFVAIGTMRGPWSDFFTPYLILQDANKWTLPVAIYNMAGDAAVKMNTYMLALVLSSIPGLLIFALFQKYIIGGVNIGAVKG